MAVERRINLQKEEMKKGKYDSATSQEPEVCPEERGGGLAVSSATQRESSRLNDVRRIGLAGGHR